MTSRLHHQQLGAPRWVTSIGTGIQQSIRHIGDVIVAWLRQQMTVSQAATLQESRLARMRAYDAQVIRRAVNANSPNEADWLLYTSMITDAAKRRYCLERALAINPDSTIAASALAKLSGPLI